MKRVHVVTTVARTMASGDMWKMIFNRNGRKKRKRGISNTSAPVAMSTGVEVSNEKGVLRENNLQALEAQKNGEDEQVVIKEQVDKQEMKEGQQTLRFCSCRAIARGMSWFLAYWCCCLGGKYVAGLILTKTVGYNASKDEDNDLSELEMYDEMIDNEKRCCPKCCWPDDKNCASRVRVFQILLMMSVTLTVPTIICFNVWRGASDCESQLGGVLWHGASPQRVLSSAFLHDCNLTAITSIHAPAATVTGGTGSVVQLQSLPDVVTSMPLLEKLNVAGHNITSLPCALLDGVALPHLSLLDLTGNPVASILSLDHCGPNVTRIPPYVLSHLASEIEELSLGFTSLECLPEPKILANMKKLKSLDLGHTNINDVTPSVLSSLPLALKIIFAGTPLSKELDWSGRRYSHETLASNLLNISRLLPEIRSLNFSGNYLQGLPNNMFNLLPALKRLDVGRNPSFVGGRSDLLWRDLLQLEYLDLSYTGVTANDVSIPSLTCDVVDWFRKIGMIKNGGINLAGNPNIGGFFHHSRSFTYACKCLNVMESNPQGYTMLNRTLCPGGWEQKKNLEEGVWRFMTFSLPHIHTVLYRPMILVPRPTDASSFHSTPSFEDRGMTIVPLLSSLNPCTWSLDLDLLTTQELPKSTPSLLARLPRLQELKLKNINGTLPEEFIGARHTNFRRLDIMGHYGGPLQGWISPHGDLPLSLGELSNLKSFTVNNCPTMDMSRLSDILARLVKLEILNMKNVGILRFPSSLVNLMELKVLRLDDNNIVGNIPADLLRLTKLTSLWLHQNKFTGSIPAISGENLKDITLCDIFIFFPFFVFFFFGFCFFLSLLVFFRGCHADMFFRLHVPGCMFCFFSVLTTS